MYKLKNFTIYFLSFVLILTSLTVLPSTKLFASAQTKRLAGDDRYITAIEISKAGWNEAQNVILATGEDFPDALSAAPLSKQLNAPILLTVKSSLNDKLVEKLERLKADKVYIIGGIGVVSTNIEAQLEAMGKTVIRIAGDDRYSTSIEVAKYLNSNFAKSKEIVVATGENFPDALSIAPIAANKGLPIILASKTGLSKDVKKYIDDNGITKAYIIGGTGVVSDAVMQELPGPERIKGSNRYDTNAAILERFKDELDFSETYIATGEDFPDALAGSALAPKTLSPIVLTSKTPEASIKDIMEFKYSLMTGINVLGGDGVIPASTLQKLIPVTNTAGNSNGNLANGSFVASQGDWIYYVSYPTDDQGYFITERVGLYKMREDGSGKTQLSAGDIRYINVVGDWVYYIDNVYIFDSKGNIEDISRELYKIKTDGTNKTKLTDDSIYDINVVNDWIYYSNRSDGGKLYKMKTDGSNKTMLFDDYVSYINVSGEWIYFDKGSFEGIYKIKTDGTGLTCLYEGIAREINVIDNWIYFDASVYIEGQSGFQTKDKRDQRLFKIKTDGTGLTQLGNDRASIFNVSGDWIYYLSNYDYEKIYKIRLDGTSRAKLCDDMYISPIIVIGDWIYYYDKSTLYRIKTDGTGKESID